jgi:hypothetical protein
MELAKSVSDIGNQQKQPQEPWCHTGGLKRHFYLDVERNNAQVGANQDHAGRTTLTQAKTPQTILLSGEKGKKILAAVLGEYTLLGAWNSKPYYCSDRSYHLFYKALTGWCIDQYLGYAHCCTSVSHCIAS